MAIDPDEIKRNAVKRQKQMQEAQEYMEQQAALDKKSLPGKLNANEFTPVDSNEPNSSSTKIKGAVSDFFKSKGMSS